MKFCFVIHEVFSVVFDEKGTAPLKLPKNMHKAPCAAEVRAILFMVGLHKGKLLGDFPKDRTWM